MHEGSKVERAAVVCDSRGGEYFDGARARDRRAARAPASRTARALPRGRRADAAHPLQGDAPAPPAGAARAAWSTASAAERELLAPVRERADIVIDTTGLSAVALRRKVADELLEPGVAGRLAVTFSSFGHKHGPPRDADLAFDVRFLPNPHYEPELRPLTGLRPADRRLRRPRRPAGGVLRPRRPAARVPAARSTCARARRTWWSRSAAPAAATARW